MTLANERPLAWGDAGQTRPPAPLLVLLSTAGVLCPFHVLNLTAGAAVITKAPRPFQPRPSYAVARVAPPVGAPTAPAAAQLQRPVVPLWLFSLSSPFRYLGPHLVQAPLAASTPLPAGRPFGGVRSNLTDSFAAIAAPVIFQINCLANNDSRLPFIDTLISSCTIKDNLGTDWLRWRPRRLRRRRVSRWPKRWPRPSRSRPRPKRLQPRHWPRPKPPHPQRWPPPKPPRPRRWPRPKGPKPRPPPARNPSTIHSSWLPSSRYVCSIRNKKTASLFRRNWTT